MKNTKEVLAFIKLTARNYIPDAEVSLFGSGAYYQEYLKRVRSLMSEEKLIEIACFLLYFYSFIFHYF
jgi:hypothetical protein